MCACTEEGASMRTSLTSASAAESTKVITAKLMWMTVTPIRARTEVPARIMSEGW